MTNYCSSPAWPFDANNCRDWIIDFGSFIGNSEFNVKQKGSLSSSLAMILLFLSFVNIIEPCSHHQRQILNQY